jgi:S-adenosylmethionine:tRNA ribosyltransferase-isomerase
MGLRTADFHYDLPPELIADRPLERRSDSRMMVIDRAKGTIEHKRFTDFESYLRADDLVMLNDTRVIPARVFSDDGGIELLCLDRLSPVEWRCLVRPGKKMKVGRTTQVGGITGTVIEVFENGDRLIRWESPVDLDALGHLALPHYMGREDEISDRERYQTVFAKEEGAIAAPTAGLHFTPELLARVPHDFLTLHVGVGTFRPVQADRPEEHVMHSERYALSTSTARKINSAGRVLAVGTTVTRVLETLGRFRIAEFGGSGSDLSQAAKPRLEWSEGQCGLRIGEEDQSGETDIFIYPPYDFRVVGALLTNFHLPESTLIMLVSAFAGRELVLEAYRQAVAERYRFYSYGDCMLIV